MADPSSLPLRSAPAGHVPALDGLRGMAASIVVVSHCANAGFLPSILGSGYGQFGVALFYALSGFLMAFLYIERPFSGPNIKSYTNARVARVVPLYWAVVGASSLLLLVAGTSLYGMEPAADVAKTFFFIQGNGVFWSIPVEIHYYILFLLLWFLYKSRAGLASFAIVFGLQIAALFALSGVVPGGRWIWYWLHFFLLGGLLAVFVLRGFIEIKQASKSAFDVTMGVIAMGLIVFVAPGVRGAFGFEPVGGGVDPLMVFLPILVLFCGLRESGPFRVFSAGIPAFLGRISFGIYLLHVPCLIVAEKLEPVLGAMPGAQFLFTVVVTVVLSYLSLRLWELPAANYVRSLKR